MRLGDDKLGLLLLLEVLPAALFAGASGVAASAVTGQAVAISLPAVVGVGAFVLSWCALRRLGSTPPKYAMPPFDASEWTADPDAAIGVELPQPPEEELLLDEVLLRPNPESRVVQLFEPVAAIPEGRDGPPVSREPDASQLLHEALDALRRSLR